jgi:ABC-type branched-subunit amino acid transport system permease subunit
VRLAAPWIALAAVFLILPTIFPSGSALTMLSLMGIMIVFALSYNMLLGETGCCPSVTRSITASAVSWLCMP